MNIATLIAKFIKDGLASLKDDEKELLKDNVSLMSPSQREQFEKSVKEADEASDEDKDGDDAPEGDDGAGDGKDDEAVDEKALKSMISNSVQDEIAGQVDAISERLVSKFFAGAKAQRKKAIDTGEKADDPNRENTRTFFKALLSGNKEVLKSLSTKASTFNQTGDDARGGYLIPEELRAEVLRIAEAQYGLARRDFTYLPFSGPGNERKIPTLASSVTVNWTNESVKKTGTNPTFGLVTQTLKKLAAIIPFTVFHSPRKSSRTARLI